MSTLPAIVVMVPQLSRLALLNRILVASARSSLFESDPDWRGSLARLSQVPLVVAAVERPHVGRRVVAEHAAHYAGVGGAEVIVTDRPPDAFMPILK